MKIDNLSSDTAVIQEIGERVAKHRLNRNLTQAQLADLAGVSLSTVNRMEAGNSSQIVNLVRVFRAMGLLENMDALISEPTISPIQRLDMAGKQRQRARPKKAKATDAAANSNPASQGSTSSQDSSRENFMQGFSGARAEQLNTMLGKSAVLTRQAGDAAKKLAQLQERYPPLEGNAGQDLADCQESLNLALEQHARINNALKAPQSSEKSSGTLATTSSADLEQLGAIQQQLQNNIEHSKRVIKRFANSKTTD